ncbi:uncharacterized protein LOC133926944 isoform X2 [Phragmites australis]|uniref:uncharacterized protein LOC133926944 isoform X2 n=1 Tax=Phragmites australis TaxID=29695 RepID=UPI002D77F513|nr:uncharacterized protein LOC133926944 isoform X2 [Phragmites australis]
MMTPRPTAPKATAATTKKKRPQLVRSAATTKKQPHPSASWSQASSPVTAAIGVIEIQIVFRFGALRLLSGPASPPACSSEQAQDSNQTRRGYPCLSRQMHRTSQEWFRQLLSSGMEPRAATKHALCALVGEEGERQTWAGGGVATCA